MKTRKLADDLHAIGLVQEAQAFLDVARVLEGRPREEACSIMAAVSSILGLYDFAEQFNRAARRYREEEERRFNECVDPANEVHDE